MSKILIVDDSHVDQLIIKNIMQAYDTVSAYNGLEAMAYLKDNQDVGIMILDLNMPKMNGFEVLEAIKKDYYHLDLPILILTNYEEIENEIRGLDLGAVDYIRKPLNADSLVKRIEVHLNLMMAKKAIKAHNETLEEMVRHRTKQLLLTRDITIKALVGLLEVRDIESCNHTKRCMLMMKALCEHLATYPKYKDILSLDKVDSLYKTAPLHDIGKVGIPDRILLKPGKLTFDEYELMKEHVQFGVDAICSEFKDDEMDAFMSTAINVIGSHHERFDGTGYPNGLKAYDIPLEGRLMAVIDVFDALSSKRVYKEAFDYDFCFNTLLSEKGLHFDPDIVDAFLEIKDQILEISLAYRSEKEDTRLEII